jgi:hypothetical protein
MASGVLNFRALRKSLNDSTRKYFGIEAIQTIQNYQLYLNKPALQQSLIPTDTAVEYILKWMRSYEEIAYAFELKKLGFQTMPTSMKELFANGYYPTRSGDIQIVLNPQIQYNKWEGADHGSIYNYDRHIPLLWLGHRIPPGKSFRQVAITDIAPTVAAILGIQMPNASVGKVLEEVVR